MLVNKSEMKGICTDERKHKKKTTEEAYFVVLL